MRKPGVLLTVTAVAMLATTLVFASGIADKNVDFKKVKCVVNPKQAAKEAKAADYKGGKVYVCCGGCLGKFKKDPEKYSTMANHQLVHTKQYKQAKCPLSGGPSKAAHAVEVGGVKVAFCCGNCEGKVAKAKGKAQVDLVFGDKSFKKGFVSAAKKK
ncbi:MAG: hypothetical protein VX438_11425 [Planctomycetota bacterium]|nr:hypothetical protein [Planctomycetota bacterium]